MAWAGQYYINFKPREFEIGDDGTLIVRELEGARHLSLEERAVCPSSSTLIIMSTNAVTDSSCDGSQC